MLHKQKAAYQLLNCLANLMAKYLSFKERNIGSSPMRGTQMKVIERKSGLWNLVKIVFPNVDLRKTFFTFGDSVFTPGYITEDLEVHEQVHTVQQKHSNLYAIWWWVKYIVSKRFRYSQELEAYGEQLKFLRNRKDRNTQHRMLMDIARCLSNPLYNNMVSHNKAIEDLVKYISK